MDAYFYDGIRTPFGRRAGSLALVRPDNMLAACIDALVDRAPFAPDAFEEVIAAKQTAEKTVAEQLQIA